MYVYMYVHIYMYIQFVYIIYYPIYITSNLAQAGFCSSGRKAIISVTVSTFDSASVAGGGPKGLTLGSTRRAAWPTMVSNVV